MMKKIFSDKVAEILCSGHSLESLGVNNWGLELEDALRALDEFAKLQVAILGGDVYFLEGNKITPAYDNWYCERDPEESREAYIGRSIQLSKSYVSDYTANTNKPIFAFVVDG